MKLPPGKYLRSEDNGHIFIYDESTAKLPQMRVVHITGEEDAIPVSDEVGVQIEAPPEPLNREDWEALYISKFGRKPHPRMRTERMKQAVEAGNGNDPGTDDS